MRKSIFVVLGFVFSVTVPVCAQSYMDSQIENAQVDARINASVGGTCHRVGDTNACPYNTLISQK